MLLLKRNECFFLKLGFFHPIFVNVIRYGVDFQQDISVVGLVYFIEGKKYPRLIFDRNVFIICEKFEDKTRWRCSLNTRALIRCKARLLSYGRIIESSNIHNHPPMMKLEEYKNLSSHKVTIKRRL